MIESESICNELEKHFSFIIANKSLVTRIHEELSELIRKRIMQ
jgi:hypothetical protein